MDTVKRSTQAHKSEGEDLGVLIYKSGRSLKKLSTSVGRGFSNFGNAILLTILFLMRNFIWLAIGTCIGLGYGLYVQNKNGTSYSARMTVKSNFNSATAIYSTIDYLNALVSGGQTKELSGIFGISNDEAKRLKGFSASSVESEMIIADLYKEQFLKVSRGNVVRQDTFWVRTLNYEDFKESLTKYDYPFHNISVVSSNPSIFPKLQQGIVRQVSENSLFKELQEKQISSNMREEMLLESSIKKLDSLRIAYNVRLMRGESPSAPAGNQITLMESNNQQKTPPEIELYDKMLELSDELKNTRRKAVTEKDILEVYSPFNAVGQKMSFLQQSVARYSIIGFLSVLLILMFLAMYKGLLAFERSHKLKSGARDQVANNS